MKSSKPKRKRRPYPGRPPEFKNGYLIHKVRLRLTEAEYRAIWKAAEAQGKSLRELLKMRLRAACPEIE